MTNFIFKSTADLQKIRQLIQIGLDEQKHQRMDLAEIKYNLKKLILDKNLQKQVDDYFGDETSPQTDTENNGSIQDGN